jgi:hypothetical protein
MQLRIVFRRRPFAPLAIAQVTGARLAYARLLGWIRSMGMNCVGIFRYSTCPKMHGDCLIGDNASGSAWFAGVDDIADKCG